MAHMRRGLHRIERLGTFYVEALQDRCCFSILSHVLMFECQPNEIETCTTCGQRCSVSESSSQTGSLIDEHITNMSFPKAGNSTRSEQSLQKLVMSCFQSLGKMERRSSDSALLNIDRSLLYKKASARPSNSHLLYIRNDVMCLSLLFARSPSSCYNW
jgi:hypothetical protein